MSNKNTPLFLGIYAIAIIAFVFTVKGGNQTNLSGVQNDRCTVSSTEVAVVNPSSTSILSANGTRAWAIIQQPVNATNTIALSFDEGADAVLGQGYQLADISTSTGEAQASPMFGRGTEFPYTGEVTAIASVGTTTVLITECSY
jgi:hypothetical protein